MLPHNLEKVISRIEEIENKFVSQRASLLEEGKVNRDANSATSETSFDDLIKEYAQKYQLDHRLARRLIEVESNFNPDAVSPRGAMGLMQLMPQTCQDLGVQDPFDEQENLEGGMRYLRGLLNQFGSLPLALAAYNAGPSRVKEYGDIPPFPETQEFVKKVIGERK
ncbi:MAG: lytic transglycosylase domain-containing protein [Candidatus Atribacteria bacterium]|nr:lytic transglycosylase domain-containing protein [Candidatus Atribacteria bacterium]